METKLTTITPTYRTFVPDQVLTAGQLNEFLNYFEDQDRLSRIFLSGVGIVCGFKVQYNSTGELVISQGAGITTDGDLFKLSKTDPTDPALELIDIPDLRYTYYRAFDDSNARYTPFFWRTINNAEVQLNLWEAIPEADASPSDQLISTRTDLQNLVVLLYLESYEEDPNACTGIECENQGIKNIRKLRVLFTSQSDADYILSNDTIFDTNYLISTYLNIDEVAIQRVTVNTTNSASFAALRSNYLSAIQSENIIGRLKNGYTTMLSKLGMTAKANEIESKIDQFFGTGATYPYLFFQYRYDLLRDLVNGYNELKDLFLESVCNCNPDIHSFPKHLMLGRLIPTQQDRYLKQYRHEFYKSPILEDEKNWCERFNLYVDRTIEMLDSYQGDIPAGEVRITPSIYRSTLENKAVPFYLGFGNFPRLLETWNYDKYKVNKQNRNLSYYTSFLDPSGPIQFPLRYNLEPHNFLNIEGHQGYTYQMAMQRINDLKNQYGLAFDVKALGITINETDPINMDDYACQFEDLQILLNAWKQEHNCLLGKVSKYYSAFSTQTLGANYLVEDYMYPIADGEVVAADNNAVKENMFTGANSLGVIMLPVIDRFHGCSGNDIMAQVNNLIDRFDYGQESKDLVDATLKAPNDVLSHAYVLIDKSPATLADVLPSVIESVNTSATNLCGAARKTYVKASTISSQISRPVLSMLYNLSIDTTALCCSAEKLQLIYDEIEKRKKDILIGLSLAKFQEQHPGMEHLAGVHQGDTFLLVYIRDAVNGIGANTVVADFTLPYLCCSDCRPVGFIMPEIIVDLRLGSNSVCVKEGETTNIPLFRYPADGTVALSPAVEGIDAEGDQLVINPALVPESVYDQVIHFTLNGHETSAELTLHKATAATMIVPDNPITSTTVDFDCELPGGTDPTVYSFFWDFGDGTTSVEQNPTHTYAMPITEATVRLTVISGNQDQCPATIEKTLLFSIDPGLCEAESTTNFNTLKNQLDQIIKDNSLTQASVQNLKVFYADVAKSVPVYLSGDQNSLLGSKINDLSQAIFDDVYAVFNAGGNVDPLVSVYHNSMHTGLTLVRCQEEALFVNPMILKMIEGFTNGMDVKKNPSFPNMGIQSNTPYNINFLNNVLSLRKVNSVSWTKLNELLVAVSWEK
nr:PKD domain-containing protein [uncultured Fluviicola sp.]